MIKKIIEEVNGEIVSSEESKFCDRCGVEKKYPTDRRNTWDFKASGYGGNFKIEHKHLCWDCYSGVKKILSDYFTLEYKEVIIE